MANNNHFTLTLDTLAPTGSVSRGSSQFVKANFNLTIVTGDATFMYVWSDGKATGVTSDMPDTPIAAAASYTTAFTTSGVYYYHVVLMDDVGNQSEVYNTESITYDIIKPVVDNVELCKRDGTAAEVVTTREIAVKFKASDAAVSSGLVSCAISGDIDTASTSWVSALTAEEIATLQAGNAVQRNVVLSGSGEEESTKTVSITVTDAAGNVADAVSDTITLDTKFLVGNIILRDSTDTKTITDTWVNTADFNIALDASEKSDWKGYKVWGDFNTDGGATTTSEPDTFTDLTEAEKTAKRVLLARKFTSGDAENKTVNAKIIDDSGNITTLTAVSADVDYSAPTVTLAIQAATAPKINTHVSKVTGYTSQVLVPTVDASISGAKSFQWYMNGTAFGGSGASGEGAPVNLTVDSANMGDEGKKDFTLKVVDNAGNETTSAAVTIYLDTTAPTGTITMAAWYNGDAADQTTYKKFSAAGVTASATDGPTGAGAAGMLSMQCWCSQVAEDTTAVGTVYDYAANLTHGQVDWTSHAESNTNYIHIKYTDKVGNSAIMHSAAFGIDTGVPGDGTITFTKEAYPSTAAQVVLGKNDATSGMGSGAQFKVWGDITVDGVQKSTEDAASWESIADSKSVVLTTGDGTKTIYVRYKDVAGNISGGTASNDTTELDTSTPSITPSLHVSGESTAKPAKSNVKESDLHVKISDDNAGKVFYQVYGDFTTDGTQAAQGLTYHACTLYAENTAIAKDALVLYEGNVYIATSAVTAAENTGWSAISSKMTVNTDYWKEYVVDSGKDYKNVATVCTSGDGTKNFNARAMDNAGNITQESAVSFIYDTTAPVVTVGDPDFNRLSKVQTKRYKNESGTITQLEKYNDQTIFTFSCDSVFVEYKVCAYVSQAAAEAGTHADSAIPVTSGRSANLTGTGTFGPGQTTETITSTIGGTDYESALLAKYNTSAMTQAEAEALGFTFEDGEVNGIDGAHIVVVYVKDEGGTWSVAADFTA